jgi:hypothetical protein
MNGYTVHSSFETFSQVQEAINSIDLLVDSIKVDYEEVEHDIDDHTSHFSWGI